MSNYEGEDIEVVPKELNHLAAILHVYAGDLYYIKEKKNVIFFQKENGNTFTLLSQKLILSKKLIVLKVIALICKLT